MSTTMKKSIIASAEIISDDTDLLTQILLRLPTKPLLKFKCVSKQWLSLISDPYFCLSHTRYHQINGFLSPTALVLKWIHTLPSEFDVVPLKHDNRIPFFDYLNYSPNINVIQSCYGMFLCKSVVEIEFYENIMPRYFICNPSTRKFKELSFPENPFRDSKFYVYMAFDPLKSPHYKVICLRKMAAQPSNYSLDVYSSETDSWSLSRISFPVNNLIRIDDAVFSNGKIHWYGFWVDSLYFDVENESLEPLRMPDMTMQQLAPREHGYMGACRGVLYIVMVYFYFGGSEMDVFEMASDYSHWTLKHRLSLGNFYKDFPEIFGEYIHPCSPSYHINGILFSDVCITQLEKDDEPKVVIWIDNKVIFFDFNDETWKSLYDLRPGVISLAWDEYEYEEFFFPYQSRQAYHYFEDLSCV